MPSLARTGGALLVVGLLLLAAPPLVDALTDDPTRRSSQVLGARELGESHDGDPRNETKDLVGTWEGEHVLDAQQYAALSARGSTDHLDCAHAVPRTVDVLQEAAERGEAVARDDDVEAALGCMADRYDYYRPPEDEDYDQVYALRVSHSDERTTVEAQPVNDSALAATIRERELVEYGSLNASERRTVDRILDNSTDDEGYGGYRPPADDPLLDRTPMLLRKGDTTYVVETVAWVDDVNFGRVFLYLGFQGAGLLSLLAGVVTGSYALYRNRLNGRAE